MSEEQLLTVRDLVKHFSTTRRVGMKMVRETVRAVDGVDFDIARGETLGLVGESGCGKSTAGRAILRLINPTSGQVSFAGQDLSSLTPDSLRRLRRDMTIVFQDPMSALDPRMRIGEIVTEPLRVHRIETSTEARRLRARELLEQVGLRPEFADRYPHEFSGGQRQRIGIARAIATDPKLIVLDEPISALDISVRAQILNLLKDLQESRGLAYLFIAHDLAVVRHICDRVAVMYLGVIVETGPAAEVFDHPRHPYTKALIASAPSANPRMRTERVRLEGDVPTAVNLPSGCRFRTRCPIATERCSRDVPELRVVGESLAACHFAE